MQEIQQSAEILNGTKNDREGSNPDEIAKRQNGEDILVTKVEK